MISSLAYSSVTVISISNLLNSVKQKGSQAQWKRDLFGRVRSLSAKVEPAPLRRAPSGAPPRAQTRALGLRFEVSQPDGREAPCFGKDVAAVRVATLHPAEKTYGSKGTYRLDYDLRESHR